jgi:hypothetical protein
MNLSTHKIKIDDFSIRWMIRPDIPQVLDIIKRSFKIPISEDEVVSCLSQRNIISQILETKSSVTGQKTEIFIDVRETNLPTQLFFKKMKFKAVLVDKNYFSDTGEDSYLMIYSRDAKIKKTNRISHFEK